MTVYSNRVDLESDKKPTAMILPVPSSPAARAAKDGLGGIVVHDMSRAANCFRALQTLFPAKSEPSAMRSVAILSSREAPALAVFRSGSYQYSVVPSLADFGRLRTDIFNMEGSEVGDLLARHYPSDQFVFLACIIDASAEFAPIAYTHDKHVSGTIFVPTRHHHGPSHRGHFRAAAEDHAAAADWDHEIYSIGSVDTRAGEAMVPPTAPHLVGSGFRLADWFRSRHVDLPFAIPSVIDPALLHRLSIKGTHPNSDVWFIAETALVYCTHTRRCTRGVTGSEPVVDQPWFICNTCTAAKRFGPLEGVCAVCAANCHAGHSLTAAGRSPFFCDCPSVTCTAGGSLGYAAAAAAAST